ncbi:MAG: dienelactone hydrolase family protein [Nitrospira sp.]|nr:dienelactone hydrolase family protein [Nitrospira sp.]MDH4328828.1 dienelactone hydrolase family protein [Nitrospira sp.]MDH5253190.1 dienelactone hydrolase family protein [Nitrospira sp.]MDH5625821.1 dienelactone hydrolase family protein [Nitrospira sp.]
MTQTQSAPFTLEQIGTGTARFPSGVPIPTHTDQMVDPYFKTRMPKEHQIDSLLFWPQAKGVYPGLLLLHDRWGLTGQMKDLGARLACEGYLVIIPNLYGRLGGMVTANDEVASALQDKQNEAQVLTDINSCCEYLNMRDMAKRNIHGVVGYGMGGSYALRFACQRKRLRAVVSYYGKMVRPRELMNDITSPLLYHQAGKDTWATEDNVHELRAAVTEYGKRMEIHTYPDVPHAFCNEMKPDAYRPEATALAWERTAAFLKACFQGT